MITVTMGFEPGSLTSDFVVTVARAAVRFSPQRFRLERNTMPFRGWDEFSKRLQEAGELSRLHLSDGNSDFGVYFNRSWQLYGLVWTQSDFTASDQSLLDSMASQATFRSGFCGDESTLVLVQSPHDEEHLNPARQCGFPGMWLVAGWKNWYGQWAFSHLNRERLADFSPTFEKKDLPGGGLYVALTEDPCDPDLPLIQAKYWKETGLETLEALSFQESNATNVNL